MWAVFVCACLWVCVGVCVCAATAALLLLCCYCISSVLLAAASVCVHVPVSVLSILHPAFAYLVLVLGVAQIVLSCRKVHSGVRHV